VPRRRPTVRDPSHRCLEKALPPLLRAARVCRRRRKGGAVSGERTRPLPRRLVARSAPGDRALDPHCPTDCGG
jgi:hypothetical protein